MVRKEQPEQDGRVIHVNEQSHGLVEDWLTEIRRRVPPGSHLSATLQIKPRVGYLASFRLESDGEVLSSQARAEDSAEAVNQAAKGICQHLPTDALDFSEAG